MLGLWLWECFFFFFPGKEEKAEIRASPQLTSSTLSHLYEMKHWFYAEKECELNFQIALEFWSSDEPPKKKKKLSVKEGFKSKVNSRYKYIFALQSYFIIFALMASWPSIS